MTEFDDGNLAREIAGLLMRRGDWEAINRIKEIGKQLLAQGTDRPAKISERVKALGGNVRELDLYWSGLGK